MAIRAFLQGPMRFRPGILAALAAVETVLLAALAVGGEASEVPPGQAALHEGLGRVRVSGIVRDVRPDDGLLRLTLVDDSGAVEVRVEGALPLAEGSWAQAEGRVARLTGRLTLVVESPDRIETVAAPGPVDVGWAQLSADPGSWTGQALRLDGWVRSGALHSGDGHHALVGHGPWPKEGAVRATVTVRYDAGCLCHRLDASDAGPAAFGQSGSAAEGAALPWTFSTG